MAVVEGRHATLITRIVPADIFLGRGYEGVAQDERFRRMALAAASLQA